MSGTNLHPGRPHVLLLHIAALIATYVKPCHFTRCIGSGKFSLDLVRAVAEKGGAQIVTLALRRANAGGAANILEYIPNGAKY